MNKCLGAIFIAVAAGALFAAPAAAKDLSSRQGYYFSGFVGVAFDVQEQEVDVGGLFTGADIDFNVGWSAVGAGLGYAFDNGLRVEGSFGYSDLTVGTVSTTFGDVGGGRLQGLEFMLNGYYDFLREYRLQPYVGVGLGVQRSKYKDVDFLIAGPLVLDDSAVEVGGQAILGIGGWVADHWHLGLEYRLFGNFSRSDFALSDGTPISVRFLDHRVLLGVRYSFGLD